MHQRVAKRGPQKTTIYAGDLYECEDNSPTPGGPVNCTTHRYKIYGGGKLVAVVTDKDFSRETQFVHADRLGSSSLITDAQGNEVEDRDFEAFGSPIGNVDFTSTGINSGFTGQEHDAELGLINMGGRLYDPKIGRFITADPFVMRPLDPQGLNRYLYVQNNPLNLVDPSGFEGGPDISPLVPWQGSSAGSPGGGYAPSSGGTCNVDGSYSYPNTTGAPDSRVDVGILPDGPNSPRFDSSSSNPGAPRAPTPPSPASPAAPSSPAQSADGAPSPPVSQSGPPAVGTGGPPATPPSPEGGPGTQGVAGSGNLSGGALANPVGGPQSPNNPAGSWSAGSTGAPSSATPGGVGYRGSNAGGAPNGSPEPRANSGMNGTSANGELLSRAPQTPSWLQNVGLAAQAPVVRLVMGLMNLAQSPNSPNISPKIERQMGPRGWTPQQIKDAIMSGDQVPAINKLNGNPAIRYINPETGQSVVVDTTNNEVIHVGGPGFRYGPGSGDLQ